MSDELSYASLVELGLLLGAGEITSVALTEHFLDRLETHAPTLNAVVTVTRERALREARQADEERAEGIDRGPLHGIPTAPRICWPRSTTRPLGARSRSVTSSSTTMPTLSPVCAKPARC